MSNNEISIEVIENRDEILTLAGYGLYSAELEEKLYLFKVADSKGRKYWTSRDLDVYLRKVVSTAIVDNEFKVPEQTKSRRIARPRTDKELILKLSETLGIEIMAIKYIYQDIKNQLQLTSSKTDDRNFISAQLYAHLDDLDLRIAEADNEKDAQRWYELKMKTIDQFAKIKNLEEKQNLNTAIVHGNVSTQNNNTVGNQLVISEQEAMMNLLAGLKILPSNN